MRDLPKLQRGGRLYIAIGEPYREALWDYFHGDGTAQVWDVDRSYRRDDLLLTLVPTQPRMFIALEIATANGADTSDIQVDWNRSIAFQNGVLVDAVAKRAGIRKFQRYYEGAEARRIWRALDSEYRRDAPWFTPDRIHELNPRDDHRSPSLGQPRTGPDATAVTLRRRRTS